MIDADIICPYFINLKEGKKVKQYITCEGVEGSCYNTMRFIKSEDRAAYIRKFCVNYPNNCPIAQANEKKYKVN